MNCVSGFLVVARYTVKWFFFGKLTLRTTAFVQILHFQQRRLYVFWAVSASSFQIGVGEKSIFAEITYLVQGVR